jgi:hypothetical protein
LRLNRSGRRTSLQPPPRAVQSPGERPQVEIVIGLVIYAIIWTVVIVGSEHMNKNIQ